MARAIGAIATDGIIRDAPIAWSAGSSDPATSQLPWIRPEYAATLRKPLREVVTRGTGRVLAHQEPAIAGKTGTAEVHDARSHSWFVGYAPHEGEGPRIAFAVVIEHGGYGGGGAARMAGDLVEAARKAGVIR
jgi:cell division protein FtsI/penicillin-binding protein 2